MSLAAILLALASPGTPQAAAGPLIPAFFTGEALWRICREPNAGQCSMYVAGVLDGIFLADSGRRAADVCPPRITNREAADIVTRFLEENPAIRERAAAVAVSQAIRQSFPCPDER